MITLVVHAILMARVLTRGHPPLTTIKEPLLIDVITLDVCEVLSTSVLTTLKILIIHSRVYSV